MKILIGCEESGRVREAFRGVGHDAWSCDLLPCTENPSKYHIQDDLLKVIKSEKWDMIIAFPPCTHLAISGAKYFPEKIADGRQQAAIDFVEAIWDADCPRIAIENPVGVLSTKSKLGKASQYIQPYWFGERQRKKTGLWLKGLPKLVPTDMVDISKVPEKELNKLYYLAPSPTRALERSKTFKQVALCNVTTMGVTLMQLNKQEIKFLDDHFNDIYYLLEVENMTMEGQKIFYQSIQNKLSKEAN